MMQIVSGERIGQLGKIRLGCSAAIFDETANKLLLTKRADNGEWCLPGGWVEPGESVAETCIREVWEETGLRIEITQLIGVYSNQHLLVEYPDGNRFQQVSLCFAAKVLEGELGLSDETTAYGFYSLAEIQEMTVLANSVQRIYDAFDHQPQAYIY
jgi:8-oxo-dGTP pyrophosphatase MutT (NUDIX family)